MIQKYIGQIASVATLNETLAARKNTIAKGERYNNRPIFFGGFTGTGKSNLAKAFTSELAEQGFNLYEMPQNSGWGELSKMAEKVSSFDEATGRCSAIPHVIFWDEFHSQKIGNDLIKSLMTKVDEEHTIFRNGKLYHYDPANHIHIFASNRKIDPALQRRCLNLTLTTYTPAEMARLVDLFLTKKHGLTVTDEAIKTIIGRVKPLAGDLEELSYAIANRAQAENVKKIDDTLALDVAKKQFFLPGGLRKPDWEIMKRLAEGVATVAVLKFKSADDKKKDTQERVDYLCSSELALPVRGGYALTKKGADYVEKIQELQKAKIAKKAGK